MDLTDKQADLLALIKQGEGRNGIYALAKAAARPYRRVYDHVQDLAACGLVTLENGRGTRVITRVLARDSAPELGTAARNQGPRRRGTV